MSIESKIPTSEVNVKDIHLQPEQRQEGFSTFEVTEKFPEEQWPKIMELVEKYRRPDFRDPDIDDQDYAQVFGYLTSNIKNLDPENFTKINLSGEDYENFYFWMDKAAEKGDTRSLEFAHSLITLFPGKAKDVQKFFPEIQDRLKQHALEQGKDWADDLTTTDLTEFAILSKNFNLEEIRPRIRKALAELEEGLGYIMHSYELVKDPTAIVVTDHGWNGLNLLDVLYQHHILASYLDAGQLSVNEEMSDIVNKKILKNSPQVDPFYVVSVFYKAKVLASKVSFTENGLKLGKLSPSSPDKIKAIPEVKKF